MKLHCPRCGAQLTSDLINLDNLAATCSACHELFGFSANLDKDRTRSCDSSLIVPDHLPILPRPPRMLCKDQGGITTIHWPWRDELYVKPLTAAAIAWNIFVVINSIAKDGALPTPLHAAISLALCYIAAAGFINFSYIHATANYLDIDHRPLPWPNREIPRHKIARLTHHSHSLAFNGAVHDRHDLYALLINGREIKLAGGLDLNELHYLKRKLEHRLNLPSEF